MFTDALARESMDKMYTDHLLAVESENTLLHERQLEDKNKYLKLINKERSTASESHAKTRDQYQSIIDDLSAALKDSEKQMSSALDSMRDMEHRKNAANRSKEIAERDFEQCRNQLNKMNGERNADGVMISELTEKLSLLRKELDEVRQQLVVTQRSKRPLVEEVNELKKELNETRVLLADKDDEVSRSNVT